MSPLSLALALAGIALGAVTLCAVVIFGFAWYVTGGATDETPEIPWGDVPRLPDQTNDWSAS